MVRTSIRVYLYILLFVLGFSVFFLQKDSDIKQSDDAELQIGQEIDNFNGVAVFYNDAVSNVVGRNTAADGYNLGLKYQCVEFVKRYYYQYLNHKMPDSYGHAKDFFDVRVADGQENKKRGLNQYTNPSQTKPQVSDLLIFAGTVFNRYGHVAIISAVTEDKIEIIQQNPGFLASSRATITLEQVNNQWQLGNKQILGWLRKED